MSGQGQKVDDSIRLEIIQSITAALAPFKKDIIDHFDTKLDPIKETQERHTRDIADLYEKHRDVLLQISSLSQRQANDEGDRAGRDKQGDKDLSKAGVNWTAIGVIIALLAAIGAMLIK